MSSPGQTHWRSCLACNQRKVKCDRQRPCSNCLRWEEPCRFPQSRIRRNRPRAPANEDKIIEDLEEKKKQQKKKKKVTTTTTTTTTTRVVGLLVVDAAGQSRLLADDAWANVKEENANFSRSLLDNADERTLTSPLDAITYHHHHHYHHPMDGILDGLPLCDSQKQQWIWTPTPAQLELCWYIYVDNVDPVVCILHKPTVRALILDAQHRKFDELDTATRSLLLALCFSAIHSLDAARCKTLFGEDGRLRLKQRCKSAVEQAIVQARLIQTHNIQVVQAFTLFLACVPRDGSRTVWTLIGLAIRIATSLGLHRDGTDFGLSPFEVEIRRRLWWELRMLDVRASEDYGTPPSIIVESNTRFPLNINDADLDVSASIPPTEHDGATEMSFSLLRYEICSTTLPMMMSNPPCPPESFEDREKTIGDFRAHIGQKYVQLFDRNRSAPFFHFAAEAAGLLLMKVRLLAHQVLLRSDHGGVEAEMDGSGGSFLDELFQSSIVLIESHRRVAKETGFVRWKWLLDHYTQWHAVSFVLSQLFLRVEVLVKEGTAGVGEEQNALPETLQRAWDIIERVFHEQHVHDGGSRSWGPLEDLRQRVQRKLAHLASPAVPVFEGCPQQGAEEPGAFDPGMCDFSPFFLGVSLDAGWGGYGVIEM